MLANQSSTELRSMIGRCLVTGAAGFIGTQLLYTLQKNDIPVRVLLRKSVSPTLSPDAVIGELGAENISYVALLNGIDTVFHLANTAHLQAIPDQYQSDCEATIALARHAQQAGVQRFIFISSSKADNASPKDPYGYWKKIAEQRLLDEIDIPHIVIIRPCLVYGAGVKGNLDKMIHAIHRGFFPALPNISAERSMVFVNDLVNAMLLAATHLGANRKKLIVADGEAYTAYSIYIAIRIALGKEEPQWSMPPVLLKIMGITGDILQFFWMGCPVSSQAIARLTESSAYSAEEISQLGWQPTTNFYKELPDIISASLEKKP
jgi:nucleoside-diphosphate-sugar epimerase